VSRFLWPFLEQTIDRTGHHFAAPEVAESRMDFLCAAYGTLTRRLERSTEFCGEPKCLDWATQAQSYVAIEFF
jgi:hypothetical protein